MKLHVSDRPYGRPDDKGLGPIRGRPRGDVGGDRVTEAGARGQAAPGLIKGAACLHNGRLRSSTNKPLLSHFFSPFFYIFASFVNVFSPSSSLFF